MKSKKMVKTTPKKVKVQLVEKIRRPARKASGSKQGAFGPITTIDTAPVSIGNSVRGSAPVVIPVADGVRIQGRDFFCNLAATDSTITGWTLVGGAPLVPHALVSSLLKSYAGIYSNFTINGLAFHYITACPSSTQGDVMFYIGKSLGDPCVNFSSQNFMSVVLSDHNTVFGPLWQNHTASYFPPARIYPTDILNDEDLTHRGPGELLMFTKSSSEQVPGYVLMDYDIVFSGMQVNVRALTFPISRMKYTQVGLSITATAVTAGVTRAALALTGTVLDLSSAGVAPSGATVGDVYKLIMNVTPATFTNCTSTTFIIENVVNATTAVTAGFPVTDGTTVFAVYYTTNQLLLYPSYIDAQTQTNYFFFGATATITVNVPCFISLVGSIGSNSLTQSSI